MKSILLFIFMLLSCTIYNKLAAQVDERSVIITASGSGKTFDDAKQSALRNAIEQVYGSFISTKTEILKDQIVADQMVSVSSGNIESFEMLNHSQLPDGIWGVTLKAVVSISKLTSFVESKGIEVEIKGGLFALNIKQQLLNEQGEIKAVCEMVGLLHEPMQVSFDYEIDISDPKSLDAESRNWEIPLAVKARTNENIDFCANYCINTLAALSLTETEVESYKSLNKPVLPFIISYKNQDYTFYLRKQTSLSALITLFSQWEFYVRGFSVFSGLDELIGLGKMNPIHDGITKMNGKYQAISERFRDTDPYRFIFLTANMDAGTFSYNDKRTLTQIEQMTGYIVKPTGVRSQYKYGGFVVYEENGHGLVASIFDIENMSWIEAKSACDELVLNGYKDWHMPNEEELNMLYFNLHINGIGGFARFHPGYSRDTEYIYWGICADPDTPVRWHNFNTYRRSIEPTCYPLWERTPKPVRPVRAF